MQTRMLAQLRAIATEEMRTFSFTVAVVFLFSLFLAVRSAGFGPTPFFEFFPDLWGCFRSFLLAATVMLIVVEPVRRLGPAAGVRRAIALAGALSAGAAMATVAQVRFAIEYQGLTAGQAWAEWSPASLVSLFIGAMLVAVGEFHRSELRSIEATQAAEGSRSALEHEALLARVKTLEAQIEPHFLFNTLANVRRLYETDAAAGETMLTRLMLYLEVALPSMRRERSTLERELQLVAAYLDLQQVRMGRRLAYSIDIAPALRALEVPSMMLLTLVENAIKHGLTPKREGGRIDVSAALVARELRLDVSDTGRGFGAEASGGGTGLANIHARLAATFGPAGRLTLVPGERQGLTATITIPVPA